MRAICLIAETIERWVGYFERVLRRWCRTRSNVANALPLLGEREQSGSSESFSGTDGCSIPQEKLIHELFEEQVRRTPAAIAVVYEGEQLTYRELNRQVEPAGALPESARSGPGPASGMCVERSVEMVVGLLGILKAGGAYVPLDPSYPRERLEYMLEDAAPTVVLTQAHLSTELPHCQAPLVRLDAQWSEIAQHPEHAVSCAERGLKSTHLAYVIYTSGSTGHPKGVMIEHASVVNLWKGLERAIYARQSGCQRVGVNASFAFDASVKQWVQLLSGRTLVVLSENMRWDMEAWRNYVVQQSIGRRLAPPAACVFHPRCPRFQPGHCDVETPELREFEPRHEAACHYPLERWPMTDGPRFARQRARRAPTRPRLEGAAADAGV